MSIKNKLWFKVEQKIAKALGLDRIGFSGAVWPKKEDAENNDVICQVKSTNGKSISIHDTTINDLYERALIQHKIPIIGFHVEKAKYEDAKTWVAMPLENFEDLKIIEICINNKE